VSRSPPSWESASVFWKLEGLDKLVGVTNLPHRQPHDYSQREIHLISTIGFLVGAEIEIARLEGENCELSEQLETRKVIERAKGILQRDLQLSEQDAYVTLQRQSRQRRKSMKGIAEAIVLSDDVKRTPVKSRSS
jgi:GAF domain-containing protein